MGNLKKADVGVKKTTADVAAIALKRSTKLQPPTK
jgi:hypothetical protein